MSERPILFSAEMVRAILDDRKTQTRRAIKSPSRAHPEVVFVDYGDGWYPHCSDDGESEVCDDGNERPFWCPYGGAGDQLWVRETFRVLGGGIGEKLRHVHRDRVQYFADEDQSYIGPYRPSIHMPRHLSRIQLRITDVRVERLQDISEADAVAEGVERRVIGDGWQEYGLDPSEEQCGTHPMPTARDSYRTLWESISGRGSWAANSWVWAIAFERLKP